MKRTSGWLPDETQESILRAALAERGQEAREAWSQWKSSVGVEHAEHHSFGLLPLVYRNLTRLGVEDDELSRLKGTYRYNWSHNQLLMRSGAHAIEELRGAGIETLVLKGAALSVLAYRDLGARPMADFDLLVPRERAHEALAILRRSLSPSPAYPHPEALIPVRHSAPLIDDDRQEIDLHWYSLWYSAPDAEFWEAAVPIEIAGSASLALSPSDQLLHVCTHGTWHPEGSLHWVADAMTVMRAATGGVDWDRFCDRARVRRLAAFMVEPLTWLRERFAAPIPVEVTEGLGRTRSSMIERAAQRAARRPATAVGSVLIQRERYRRLKRMDPTAPRAESFPSHMRLWLGCDTYRDLSVYAAKRLTGVRRA